MKNNKIQNAIRVCLSHQMNLSVHLFSFDEGERRRVLMAVASEAVQGGYRRELMYECIQILGFRDEEILIFARAAITREPQMVSGIVKSFCRNTTIARAELVEAARKMIAWAEEFDDCAFLVHEVLECIKLLKQQIGSPRKAPYSSGNQATQLAGHVLWLVDHLSIIERIDNNTHTQVVASIRQLVPNDGCWQRLQDCKVRLGGKRRIP